MQMCIVDLEQPITIPLPEGNPSCYLQVWAVLFLLNGNVGVNAQ